MWSSTKSLPSWSTASTSSSASTKVKSWTQAFTSTLLTLGEEEVLIDNNKSIAQSTLSGGLIRRRSSVRCNTPEITQPQPSNLRKNSFTQSSAQNQQFQEQQDCMSVVTYDNPSYLEVQQKDDELRELNLKYKHQESLLQETKIELKNLKLEYRKKVHELTITMDDLQWQKTSLQERLNDIEDEDLEYIEQLQKFVHDEAPKEVNLSLGSFFTKNQETNPKDRLAHHLNRLNQEGLMKDTSDQDDDDNRSRASVRSTTSGFGGRWGLSLNRSSQAQQNQILHYTAHMQSKLVEALYKIKSLNEKISTMEQAHEDQMSKVIHMVRDSEQERARLEVELESRVGDIQSEKRLQEHALQAKLDTKDDKIRRLEEYIEELREASQSTKNTQQKLEFQSQLTSLKEEHSANIRKLKEQHNAELEQLQAVINRFKLQSDFLEKGLKVVDANLASTVKVSEGGVKEEQKSCHLTAVNPRNRGTKDYHRDQTHVRRSSLSSSSSSSSSSSITGSGGFCISSRQSSSHSDTSSRVYASRHSMSQERSQQGMMAPPKSSLHKRYSTLHHLDYENDMDDSASLASYEVEDLKLPRK
jgi:chromosome segregation ATPase